MLIAFLTLTLFFMKFFIFFRMFRMGGSFNPASFSFYYSRNRLISYFNNFGYFFRFFFSFFEIVMKSIFLFFKLSRLFYYFCNFSLSKISSQFKCALAFFYKRNHLYFIIILVLVLVGFFDGKFLQILVMVK
jgi:hypothetical protein